MERRILNTIILSDDDLDCKENKVTLTDLSFNHLGINLEDLSKFDLVVYKGKKGTKILRSNCFRSGRVG